MRLTPALLSCLLLAVGAALFVAGCEADSAATQIRIWPDSATVTKGQSVEFTASEGYTYAWTLSDDSLGYLSTRVGDRTVYTSTYDPGTNSALQEITCTSTIPGTPGSTTNTSVYSVSATAYVTHR